MAINKATKINTRQMCARMVLGRELDAIGVGETLIVPYKYCSLKNVNKTVHVMRQRGYDFVVDNTGMTNAVIKRIK